MKTSTTLLSALICVLLSLPQTANAQFFKDVLDKTVDKTVEKTSEKVSEAASDEISDEAEEGTRKGIGGVFGNKKNKRQSDSREEDDTNTSRNDDVEEMEETEEVDMSGLFGGALENFDRSGDVPASYVFDYTMDIEIQENDEAPTPLKMMANQEEGFFGIKFSEKGQVSTMVYDPKRDLIAVYTEEKGEKKAMAMPNMVKAMNQSDFGQTDYGQQIDDEMENFRWTKTGKTKMVAGVKADEYEGEDDEMKGTFYMAQNMPHDWYENFSTLFGQMGMYDFSMQKHGLEGMMLEAHSTEKSGRNPETYHYVTKRMGEERVELTKSDYTWGME